MINAPSHARAPRRLSLLVLLITALAACGDSEAPTAPAPVPTSMRLSTTSLSLSWIGDSESVTASVLDENGAVIAGATVTWAASDGAVASVNTAGVVTAVGNGSATVEASASGLSATANVAVLQIGDSLLVSPETLVLAGPGDTAKVSADLVDFGGSAMGPTTLTWTSGDEGIARVDANGLLTAVSDGPTTVTVESTDGSASVASSINVTVNPDLVVTTSSLENAAPTVAYDGVLAATGGDGTASWAVTTGSLPTGLSLDSATGALSGTPNGTSETFTVTATSGDGQTAEAELTLVVNQVLAITTNTLTTGDRSVTYSTALDATGGAGAKAWTVVSGELPEGLTLSSTGAIAGTPLGGETQAFSVRVVTDDGQSAEQALSLTINGPPLLQPGELCSASSSDAVARFADSAMESVVRVALALGAQDDITCTALAGVTSLNGQVSGITSVLGAQNLVGLTSLNLFQNQISDVSPLGELTGLTLLNLTDNPTGDVSALSGLTSLQELRLGGNGVTDITSLAAMTALTTLALEGNGLSEIGTLAALTALEVLDLFTNPIADVAALGALTALTDLNLSDNSLLSDIQPLIDNVGLGATTTVNLENLNAALRCTAVTALQAKGVTVTFTSCS